MTDTGSIQNKEVLKINKKWQKKKKSYGKVDKKHE